MTAAQLAGPPADEPVRRSAWSVVLLLAAILFGGAAMRSVFGPLQEAARIDLHLTDFSMSLVQGVAAGAPVALISLPVAWVIDHGQRVRLLIALLGVCVIGAFWTAWAGGFVSLFLARTLSGIGAGCALSVIISLSADLCAPDHRGRAIVLLGLGAYAGAAGSFVLAGLLLTFLQRHQLPLLGAMAPWRGTHFVIGLGGTLLLFPLLWLKEPVRHEQERVEARLGPSLRALWVKRRFIAPLFIGQLGVGMADGAASIWAAPLLIRHYHQQPTQFAGWMGALILVGGVLGSVVGGFGADLGKSSGRRGFLLLAAVIATGCAIPAAVFPLAPTVTSFGLLLFILLLGGTITGVVASTTVAVLIPNEERGACMAAFAIVGALIGQLAPTLVAVGSNAMGGEQHLAPALTLVVLATGIISFAGYVVAMRNAPISATEAG